MNELSGLVGMFLFALLVVVFNTTVIYKINKAAPIKDICVFKVKIEYHNLKFFTSEKITLSLSFLTEPR